MVRGGGGVFELFVSILYKEMQKGHSYACVFNPTPVFSVFSFVNSYIRKIPIIESSVLFERKKWVVDENTGVGIEPNV